MISGGKNYNHIPTISLIILTICVCLFVLLYEKITAIHAQNNLDRHALIIADDLWNFNVDRVAEYLKLAAKADNYEYLEVVNHDGELFHKVHGSLSGLTQYALQFKFIPRVVLVAPVKSHDNMIGWIESVWIPHTLAYQLIALVFAGLLQLIITLYCRILTSKAGLEQNVLERTQQLTEANEYLLREIRERAHTEKERRNLQRRLEQSKKMETLGVLAGGVAHDLNNVLSGIVSYPDLILRDLPETSPLRQPIELIRNSGIRAAEIVQDLLTLARRGVVTKAPLELNQMILEYLGSPEHQKLLDYHPGISISLDLDQDNGIVMGSAVALKKVLMNLVANAAEAMPHGGIIQISTKHVILKSPLEGFQNVEAGEWLLFSVCDEGDGITDEDLARIFEPFYTRKVMGRSGSGLGLTVVWGTVQDHGGAVDIHHRAPKGTTIDIFLPAATNDTEQEQETDAEQGSGAYTGRGEIILIIDDGEHQREIASAILTKLGYQAVAVPSGEEALEWLENNHAELLILDMIMEGGMDGLETYQKILKTHPDQKAIIASGYSETERVRRTLSLGAGQYIKKPYQYMQLAEAVWKELRKEATSPRLNREI